MPSGTPVAPQGETEGPARLSDIPEAPPGRVGWLSDPPTLFAVLSVLFGVLVIYFNPPLRGPDEPAHFVRAFAIAGGTVLPWTTDAEGRRGVLMPAHLHEDFAFFEAARINKMQNGVNYRGVPDAFRKRPLPRPNDGRPPVFQRYDGSEGYTPVPYLPYLPGAVAGRLAGLDFVSLLTLMRVTGLAITTALIVYAIALTPRLRWAFFAIGMLPAALYGRTVISADGASLGFAMIVAALALRAAFGARSPAPERSLWMSLCVLAKPPHAAFVLLEAMTAPWRELPRRLGAVALITLPGLALSVAWVIAVDADAGSWRVLNDTMHPREFDPIWKLGFMLEHPMHFPKIALQSLDHSAELGRQLVGVLGWLDVRLRPWVYIVLTGVLALACIERLDAGPARSRIATVAWLVVFAYIGAVFLIFFLMWTPISAERIYGLQGRYFLVVLPCVAIGIAALIGRGLPVRVSAALAITGAMLSGAATVEAVYRAHW